ncbi:hypothetical protein SASPL_147036 [Salvia splendens]|uniref:Uncharacterized protein n=1 Tax=Salvia splendens TaxID=180675 RepID=A0A8X8WEG0_SALSN|nr:hypothetical protein SASPL_147036 [Salvia splendens]
MEVGKDREEEAVSKKARADGRLNSDGYGNNIVDGRWKISKASLISAKGSKLKENLYMLKASISDDSVNVTIDDIDKAKSSESHSHDDLVDIDPNSIPQLPSTVGGNAVEAEMQLVDFVDYQQDENLENPLDIDNDDPQDVEPRRSTRARPTIY